MQERQRPPVTGAGFRQAADAAELPWGHVTAAQYPQTEHDDAGGWQDVGSRTSRSRLGGNAKDQPYQQAASSLVTRGRGGDQPFAGRGPRFGLRGTAQPAAEARGPSGRWGGAQQPTRTPQALNQPGSAVPPAWPVPPSDLPGHPGMSRSSGPPPAMHAPGRPSAPPGPASPRVQVLQPGLLRHQHQQAQQSLPPPPPTLQQLDARPAVSHPGGAAADTAPEATWSSRGAAGAAAIGGTPGHGPDPTTAPPALQFGFPAGGGKAPYGSAGGGGGTGPSGRGPGVDDGDGGPGSGGVPAATASQQERLMAQARRSPFDPATNKVRCRACGKAFTMYSQLAQHLAAAHDGINSEDAKYLQFRRQQQLQEQQQHSMQQHQQLHSPDFFPSISASHPPPQRQQPPPPPQQQQYQLQTLQHLQYQQQQQQQQSQQQVQQQHHQPQARLPQGRTPSGSNPWSGPEGALSAPLARPIGARMEPAAAPAAFTSAALAETRALPIHGSAAAPSRPPGELPQQSPQAPGPHLAAYSSPAPGPAWVRPAGPQGQWAQRQAAAAGSVGPQSGEAGAGGPAPLGPWTGAAPAAAAAAAAWPAASAAVPNAWGGRRLHWQAAMAEQAAGGTFSSAGGGESAAGVRSCTGSSTATAVPGAMPAQAPGSASHQSGWVTVGGSKGSRSGAAVAAGQAGVLAGNARGTAWPAGPSRAQTPAQAQAGAPATSQPTKASKRAVTLAELLSAAVPGDGARGRGATTAARAAGSNTGFGARGAAVRVSNALRVVMKGPAARPQKQAPQGAGAGGSCAAAAAPAPSGKRLRLTAAGTIAAPRKKRPTRAKKLILQHRANRALAEAAAPYNRVRESYRKVAAVYTAMQAELQRLQQGGTEGEGTSASRQMPPPQTAATAATPAAAAITAATAATVPPRTSAAARDVVDSTSTLPPSLRPQLLLLALAKIRPQLESLHRTLARRRAAYVAKLRNHAVVHRQGEPSEAELAEQAPLDPLPAGLASAELPQQRPTGLAAEGGGGRGDGGGVSGGSGAQVDVLSDEDADSGSDSGSEVAEGFQDVLRRWAEILRLPRKLYDFEASPPGESPPGISLARPVTHVMPAAVTVHSFTVNQPPAVAAPGCTAATVTPDELAAGMGTGGAGSGLRAAARTPAVRQHDIGDPAPVPGAAKGGLRAALRPQGDSVDVAPKASAARAAAPQSSLPAWLVPSGDSSDEEDEPAGVGGPMGLFGGAPAAAWGRDTAAPLPGSGQPSKPPMQSGSTSAGGKDAVATAAGAAAARSVAAGAAKGVTGPAPAAAMGGIQMMASTSVQRSAAPSSTAARSRPGPLALPSSAAAAASTGKDSDEDDDDDTSNGLGYGTGGWTDVLNKWQSQVRGSQAAALPLFTNTAAGLAPGGVWGTAASHPFVPTAATTPGSTAAGAAMATTPAATAAMAPAVVGNPAALPSAAVLPAVQRVAAQAAAAVTAAATAPAALQPAGVAGLPGWLAAPGAFTLMGLPAPCPVLAMPLNTTAAGAAAAVFASAAAALAPAAAAEGGDEDDEEGQLSPEAATAAAALILQHHDQQAQAQAQLQKLQSQLQTPAAAQAQVAVQRPPVLGAAGAASQLNALLAATAAATASASGPAAAAAGFGVPAAAAAAVSPVLAGPPKPVAVSSWMQSLLAGGDGDDEDGDDDEEDEDFVGASGGLKVDVLAGWVASANVPKMASLFKQQQQIQQHMQQQGGFGGYSPYGIAAAGAGAAAAAGERLGGAMAGSFSAALGTVQALAAARGGSGATALSAALSAAAASQLAPAAAAATAAAASASTSEARPSGGIKIISRAVPTSATSTVAKPAGPPPAPPSSQQRQPPSRQLQQQQQQQVQQQVQKTAMAAAAAAAQSVASTAVGSSGLQMAGRATRAPPLMPTPAVVAPQTQTATAAAAAGPGALPQSRPAGSAAGSAQPTVQLLTRTGIVGGPAYAPPASGSTQTLMPSSTPRLAAGAASSTSKLAGPAAGLSAGAPLGGVAVAAATAAAAAAGVSRPAAGVAGPQSSRSTLPASAPCSRGDPGEPQLEGSGAAGPPSAWGGPQARGQASATTGRTGANGGGQLTVVAPKVNAWGLRTAQGRAGPPEGVEPPAQQPRPEQSRQPERERQQQQQQQPQQKSQPQQQQQQRQQSQQQQQLQQQQPEQPEQQQQSQQQQQLPPEFRCELCHVHCNSRWTFEQHCDSRKHIARATNAGIAMPQLDGVGAAAEGAAAAGSDAAASDEPPSPYSCSICGVCCNSDLTFQQHLASRKHMARAAMRLVQRALPGGNAQPALQPRPDQPPPPPEQASAASGPQPDLASETLAAAAASGGTGSGVGSGTGTGPSAGIRVGAGSESAREGGHASGPAGHGAAASAAVALGGTSAASAAAATAEGAARVGPPGSVPGPASASAPGAGVSTSSPVEMTVGAATARAAAGPGGGTRAGCPGQTHRLCQQLLVPELDALVLDTLTRIRGFQERAMARNAVKAAAHRWYVLGLREVHKAVRIRRARAVVVAPNIEEVAAEGGLDTTLQAILDMCEEQGTLVVFALSRKHLGRVYGFKKRVSAVAIQELNGIHDAHAQMVRLVKDAREGWRARAVAAAAAAAAAGAAFNDAGAAPGSRLSCSDVATVTATVAAWYPNRTEMYDESDDSREAADQEAEEDDAGDAEPAEEDGPAARARTVTQRQPNNISERERKPELKDARVVDDIGTGGAAAADAARTLQHVRAAEPDRPGTSGSSSGGGAGSAGASRAEGAGREMAAGSGSTARLLNAAAPAFVPRFAPG